MDGRSLPSLLAAAMVSPTINRKRGKTMEQRKRDKKRMDKANKLQAGKAKAPAVISRAIAKPSKKKLKKMEQRARLLGGGKSKMEI